MWDLLHPLVTWLGTTTFALWIGTSTTRIAWLFIFHLFGLVLLLGGNIVLSLRLSGLAMRGIPSEKVSRTVFPISTAGLALMALSGLVIFAGGADAYYVGSWFRLKMILLLIAVLFYFSAYRVVGLAPPARFSAPLRIGVSVFSLLIWFAVGWAGRAIAFF